MNRSLIFNFLQLLQRELPLGIPAALFQIRQDERMVNSKYQVAPVVSSQNVGPENRNLAKIIFIFLKKTSSPSRFRSCRVSLAMTRARVVSLAM